jgi:Trans-aconitate methyltransferase
MTNWNATQYLKFESDRTQPAVDLANRIRVEDPRKAVDIGCGPGNSTQVLAARFPHAQIIGADNSTSIIEKASKQYPAFDFRLCDANKDLASLGQDFDIVFSNACIQWIPNHPALIKNLFALLNLNGVLAVQVPMNETEPLYRLIDEVVSESRWGFENMKRETNETLRPAEYFDILADLTDEFALWETVYYHKMPTHESLVEWVKGTRLRPYLSALSPEMAVDFEQTLVKKAAQAYKPQRNGDIIFNFRRFFFTARRNA